MNTQPMNTQYEQRPVLLEQCALGARRHAKCPQDFISAARGKKTAHPHCTSTKYLTLQHTVHNIIGNHQRHAAAVPLCEGKHKVDWTWCWYQKTRPYF